MIRPRFTESESYQPLELLHPGLDGATELLSSRVSVCRM